MCIFTSLKFSFVLPARPHRSAFCSSPLPGIRYSCSRSPPPLRRPKSANHSPHCCIRARSSGVTGVFSSARSQYLADLRADPGQVTGVGSGDDRAPRRASIPCHLFFSILFSNPLRSRPYGDFDLSTSIMSTGSRIPHEFQVFSGLPPGLRKIR